MTYIEKLYYRFMEDISALGGFFIPYFFIDQTKGDKRVSRILSGRVRFFS